MKRIIVPALALAIASSVSAQSAVDAINLTQPDFKGTARFMSMGGAFTALGGDLSSLTQNPAGIGVYRRSEVGVTLDIDMQKTKTESQTVTDMSQTKVYCNNFGYIGATNLNGTLQSFNWGATYNRLTSFDRVFSGYVPSTSTSLTNYIAAFTTGTNAADLNFGTNYNPYQNSSCDWLSILAYNSYLINERPGTTSEYMGLFNDHTQGDADFKVRERGYIDEYNIDFGGNVSNVVYWGLGIGINDLSYTREVNYSESMANATIFDADNGTTIGDAGFYLDNYKKIHGTGWNMKFGVIVRPVNEFRIGFAVHTPTWYALTQNYDAAVDFSYYNPAKANSDKNPLKGNEYTDVANFDWHLYAPWRFMVGVAGVFGNNLIISADYEYTAYPETKVKYASYDNYGYLQGFYYDDYVNGDIKTYTKAGNTFRLGAEYRVSPQFSVRLGYNLQASHTREAAYNGQEEIFTSGTDPSFSFDNNTQYITAGLGYKYQAWYIDAAYVHKSRESKFSAYTNFQGNLAPTAKITDNNNSIVISTGFKF